MAAERRMGWLDALIILMSVATVLGAAGIAIVLCVIAELGG
jgi:hypothetical protein